MSGKQQEEKIKEKIMERLREHFKPEFLNRVDEIITFHPLDEKEIRAIVDLQLQKIIARLDNQGITISFTDKAKDWLAKKGYDPNLGARPLKRVIQTEVLDELAMQIVENKIADGAKVEIDVVKEKIVIK